MARRGSVGVAGDEAWRGGRRGATRRGMGHCHEAAWGGVDGAVSHDERSEELGISIDCRSVDEVDRGKSVDGPVGPVVVLERVRSRASDFLRFRKYVM
jgi:hypothetical protein